MFRHTPIQLAPHHPAGLRRALLVTSFAVAAIGTNLWIIATFGNATPYWDEWDALAAGLYIPYADSKLSLHDLLALQNEHHVFTARIVSLALTAVNGLWDPILQMIVNAVLHVALGVVILITFGSQLSRSAFAGLTLIMLALIGVSTASESLLIGLNTAFYCALLFGCAAIWLLTRHPVFSLPGVLGLAAAGLAFLSLAAGALVFLACALVVIAKRLRGAESGWQPWAFAAVLLAIFAITVMFTPLHVGDEIKAHSVSQFLYAAAALAGWPFNAHWVIPIFFVNAPAMIFGWRTLRYPPPGNAIAWALFGAGLWVGLQYLAIVYGRGAAINATRYFDICEVGLMINYICAATIIDTPRRKVLVAVWVTAIAIGWIVQTVALVPQELQRRHFTALQQEANVKSFLATGAFLPGASPIDRSLPFPDAATLARLLSDSRVRRFLPDNLQVAIPTDQSTEAPLLRRERLVRLRDALLAMGPLLTGIGLVVLLGVLIAPSVLGQRAPQKFIG